MSHATANTHTSIYLYKRTLAKWIENSRKRKHLKRQRWQTITRYYSRPAILLCDSKLRRKKEEEEFKFARLCISHSWKRHWFKYMCIMQLDSDSNSNAAWHRGHSTLKLICVNSSFKYFLTFWFDHYCLLSAEF